MADALDRLVNLIEELLAHADLVNLTFCGTPSVGFPLRREARDIPAEVVRRVWDEGLRDYDIA